MYVHFSCNKRLPVVRLINYVLHLHEHGPYYNSLNIVFEIPYFSNIARCRRTTTLSARYSSDDLGVQFNSPMEKYHVLTGDDLLAQPTQQDVVCVD